MTLGFAHSFEPHRGYIAVGADILNGTMSVGEAQERCNMLPDCLAITMVRASAACPWRDGIAPRPPTPGAAASRAGTRPARALRRCYTRARLRL